MVVVAKGYEGVVARPNRKAWCKLSGQDYVPVQFNAY